MKFAVHKKSKGSLVQFPMVVVVVLVLGFLFYTQALVNPCQTPINYTIGAIDPRFKIDEAEVVAVAEDAAKRWNEDLSDSVLSYEPGAKLKINLVYDERQAKLDEINQFVGSLDSSGNAIDSFRSQISLEVDKYQSDLEVYNSQVDAWNAKGGAPAAEYARLSALKEELDQRKNAINKKAALLSAQVDSHNQDINQLNSELERTQNEVITEGLYYPRENKIDIFTFGNKEELRLVFMHELGHALSINHAAASTSLMYPMLGDQNLADPQLSSEDKDLFNSSCRTISGGFTNFIRRLVLSGDPTR